MKWTVRELKKGDIIRVKLGNVYHYGVFLSEEEVVAFGYPPLPEFQNRQEKVSVLSTDIDVFACQSTVEAPVYSLKEKLIKNSPDKTEQIARSRIGEVGYDLIHNNCEHFAYEAVFNKHYSEQEETVRKQWEKYSQMKKA